MKYYFCHFSKIHKFSLIIIHFNQIHKTNVNHLKIEIEAVTIECFLFFVKNEMENKKN